MISTRVMDIKLREAAEGLGEDSTGKKKSKFKTFKKFFGKKKRKESPSSTGSSTWKQSQARTEVIAIESGPVGYDSEDELEESRGTLGSRALSHDSIFIPESGQDPARPVRVFSQENVCDRIKALQLKIQCNVKMGPPPPPGVLPAKRGEDAGMSSEDDGLPRSPPEMSLLHDVGPGTTIKVSLVSSSRDSTASLRNSDGSLAPVADFSHPAGSSSCLDNSAAKHKLLVKPRNQRSSKLRRLSSRAQSECLSDLTWTLEEEEFEEKPLSQALKKESPSSVQQDVVLDRGPRPGPRATLLQPGGARARRTRLQHSPALSASMEEGSSPRHEPSSRPATTEVTEPMSVPTSSVESPSLPEGSLYPGPDSENEKEVPSTTGPSPQAAYTAEEGVCASEGATSPLSTGVPEEDMTPPKTITTVTLEMPADVPDQDVPKEVELTLEVPEPQGAGKEPPAAPSPSPPPPKSCLKRRASAASTGLSGSPVGSPLREQGPCALDREAAPPERPKAEQVESPQGDRAAPERKTERGGGEVRGAKKFSVPSCRGRPRPGSSRLQEHPGASSGRLPLGRSGPAWRSEAALDDLQGSPEPQSEKPDPQKPAECDSQDSGDRVAGRTTAGAREPCRAAQEPCLGEDRNPFPVKLRSTSLSFKYRDSSAQEARGIKRYSAEVRSERGGVTLLPKDEKCHLGTAPALRGTRSPSDQGKGKARSPEQLSSKPPLPRKPLLQSLTLPHSAAPPDASPREPELRKEKKSLRKGAEKGLPPAATGPGANGQPSPPWITIARQKRRGASEQPPNQEDKPGARTPKPELGKQAKPPERAQEPVKHMDFVRSKSFLITPVKPPLERRRGVELSLQEGLQRGISLSHQNLAQSAGMMEKELHQLKRASYASADQPSWMELARKKSQAWSDMPQIIK
uniref:CRACD like n=1 Tax=Propithecus coquereli TaxID=379532 RepID=A0A2K6GGW8_PROCO